MAAELTQYDVLTEEKQQSYPISTPHTVIGERQSGVTIYPSQKDAFNAFRFTELGDMKIVILGQGSYHGPGQAHGLTSPVRPGIATPPSLPNTYEGLETTTPGFTRSTRGYLESRARWGVLLLNTVLIVHADQTHFHASLGWGVFTDEVIGLINQRRKGVAFLLQDSYVQKKSATTNTQHHHMLKTLHPSPSFAHRGFFGCNHFVLANEWLGQRGEEPINQMSILSVESE